MMNNPVKKEFDTAHICHGRERIFAIFMIPHLIHFNDKAITAAERHSQKFDQLTKFKLLSNTDNIRKILPAHIHSDISNAVDTNELDEVNSLEEALRSVTVWQYFKNYSIHRNEVKYIIADEEKSVLNCSLMINE